MVREAVLQTQRANFMPFIQTLVVQQRFGGCRAGGQ
jgi:hypothetical protein